MGRLRFKFSAMNLVVVLNAIVADRNCYAYVCVCVLIAGGGCGG